MTKDISTLIEAVNRVGIQNVSLLARMTKMPTETIRYNVKRRFPNMGLNIRTPVNLGPLGLERCFVNARLTKAARESAPSILKGLSSNAFLTYWSEAVVERRNLAFFCVPVPLTDEFTSFLDALVEGGVLSDYQVRPLEWSRHLELKSRFYDFATGQWSIDWDKVRKAREAPPAPAKDDEPSATPDIDSMDTLIIKELELDSWRNIAEIARKLGLNERTVRWHYRKHVSAIAGSGHVNWIPVSSRNLTKAVGLVQEFDGVTRQTISKLRMVFNNFPFAWFEAGRKDGYYQVHSAVPAPYFVDSLQYLNESLSEVVDDWKTWTVDLSTTMRYTIPYENFDDEKGWFFNKKAALAAIVPQRMKIGRAGA